MNLFKRAVNICIFCIPCVFFITSIVLLFVSTISYENFKNYIDAFASDGNVSFLTLDFYKTFVTKLRVLCFVSTTLGAISIVFKKHIKNKALFFIEDFNSFFSSIFKSWKGLCEETSRSHWIALSVIISCSILYRFYFLFEPIRCDEAFSYVHFSSKPFYVALSNYTYPNNHLFHTFLVKIFTTLFGNAPWILRLPVFLSGIGLVIVTYFFCRMLFNKKSGLVAAAFTGGSALLVEYSTNARGYCLVTFIFITLLFVVFNLQSSYKNRIGWILFSILASLGFYTVPTMLYGLAVVVLWLIFLIKFNKSYTIIKPFIFSIFGIFLFTSVLYLPILLTLGVDALIWNPFVQPLSYSIFWSKLPSYLIDVFQEWNVGFPDFFIFGFLVVLVLFPFLSKNKTKLSNLLYIATPIGIGLILVVQHALPPSRVWIFLLPLLYGFFSFVVTFFLKDQAVVFVSLIVIGALTVSGILFRSPDYFSKKDALVDAQDIALYLKNELKPKDRVWVESPYFEPLEYYFFIHEIPREYFFIDPALAQKNYFINKVPKNFKEPKLAQKFEHSTLYVSPGLLQRPGL